MAVALSVKIIGFFIGVFNFVSFIGISVDEAPVFRLSTYSPLKVQFNFNSPSWSNFDNVSVSFLFSILCRMDY